MSARLHFALSGVVIAAGILLAWVLMSSSVLAQPPTPHQYIDEYVGPATCATCHGDVADDVVHSVHYTWENKMDHYSPVAGTIASINWLGMLNEELGIPGGCGRCHIGDGTMPNSAEEITPQNVAGIDCLICHSPVYDTSLRFPIQTEDGEWQLTQDRSVLAARQAQRPTTENCLLCHQNVGGGPMLKRGVDFAPVSDTHGESSKGDIHATAGMNCVDCHAGDDHKVYGYAPDLWSRDIPDQRLLCDTCHTSEPHTDQLINQHVRLDCRMCHVTGTGGLVSRDWTAEPTYDPVTELYAPVGDEREPDSVQPVFQWYNGEPVLPDGSWPGSRSDVTARLQPFKEFTATVPADAASGEPIPLKLDPFYTAGNLEEAIALGASESGMDYSGQWQPKEVSTLLQISHGVVDKDNARQCQECHVPDGLVDFEALGYTDSEVEMLTTISSAAAGVRQPMQVNVVIPPSQPLPTPVNLSGGVDAARGIGVRVPWSPILVVLFVVVVIGVAIYWLRMQKPKPPEDQAA